MEETQNATKPIWSPNGGFDPEAEEVLCNTPKPKPNLKMEGPAHRRMLALSLQGLNNNEIARLLECDKYTVTNVLRQPYAQAHIVKETRRTIHEELMEFLDAELMPSLHTIKAIRDDTSVKASDRIAASKELADRRLGRPTQPFAQKDKSPVEMTSEELEAEVKELLKANGRTQETTSP